MAKVRKCLACGNEFTPTTKSKSTCSKECKKRYKKAYDWFRYQWIKAGGHVK